MNQEILIGIEFLHANPFQPRKVEDAGVILELARNIESNATKDFDGLLQVPTVRSIGDGHYQLAFGHTRKAAFALLFDEGKSAYGRMRCNVRDLDDLQMFELAVVENIKRRDLNPVEKAEAMERYMKEFGKTSKEAGAFFGVSEETVRGTVRYANLIPEGKQKLQDGSITQGTARILLSAQRVASPEQMKAIIKELEENDKLVETSTGRWEEPQIPEIVIQEAVEQLPDVVELWWEYRDGKPRSRSHDGWLLAMKNFPNKYLPDLTGHIAVQALDCFNDKPAQALVLEWAEKREDEQLTQLGEINPEYVKKLQHLIDPPACTACPFYTTIRGNHYCGMKACHTRKEAAWDRELMHKASKSLGIPVYDAETDGDFIVLQDAWNNQEHKELFQKKNKDLRLALMVDIGRKKWQNGYDGTSRAAVVIVTGKTLKKLQAAKVEAAEARKQDVDPEEIREELYEEKCDVLDWEATLYFKTLFDGWNLGALDALDEASYGFSNNTSFLSLQFPPDDASDDEKTAFERRRFAWFMIGEIGLWNDQDSLVLRAEKLGETAKAWGIKLPVQFFKMAKQMEDEISEAVSAATQGAK